MQVKKRYDSVKTLTLLIVLILVFVLGYMLGVVNTRPKERTIHPPASADTNTNPN